MTNEAVQTALREHVEKDFGAFLLVADATAGCSRRACRDSHFAADDAFTRLSEFLGGGADPDYITMRRQRDEGIELLRSVEEVWEDPTGRCDEDCDCVVHAIRAFLSNFPEEDAE